MSEQIEMFAGKHLGRTSDGATMTRYETPDEADASLLVPVPRVLNREQHNINPHAFEGFDVWNCYEVSFLLDGGMPISGLLKLVYSSQSENIVESKSLKLYLNSFNMQRMGKNVDEAVANFTIRVVDDLDAVLNGGAVKAHFVSAHDIYGMDPASVPYPAPFGQTSNQYRYLEQLVDLSKIDIKSYDKTVVLKPLESVSERVVSLLRSCSLRSNCRVTNQPDWGDVFIKMESNTVVDHENLLKHIVSMRKENHFHEEICEALFKNIQDVYQPNRLMVACLYTRRGGIDINPVRCTPNMLGEVFVMPLFIHNTIQMKSLRQ